MRATHEETSETEKGTGAVRIALGRLALGLGAGIFVGALLGAMFGNVVVGMGLGVPVGAAAVMFMPETVRSGRDKRSGGVR